VADPLGSRISLLRETAWSFFFFTQDELHSLIDEYYLRAGALLSTPLYPGTLVLKSIEETKPLERQDLALPISSLEGSK
jgi:hypothetical protein